jgi:hypothetical protein
MAIRRVIAVAVGCALAVAIGVSVGAFAAHRRNLTGPPAGSRSGPLAAASADPGAGTDARGVAAALAALGTDPQSLVAAGAVQDVGGRAQQAVPGDSRVTAAEHSWAPDGVGGGTIAVTVTPLWGTAVTYAAVMVREGGRWKVLATVPLGVAPAGDS